METKDFKLLAYDKDNDVETLIQKPLEEVKIAMLFPKNQWGEVKNILAELKDRFEPDGKTLDIEISTEGNHRVDIMGTSYRSRLFFTEFLENLNSKGIGLRAIDIMDDSLSHGSLNLEKDGIRIENYIHCYIKNELGGVLNPDIDFSKELIISDFTAGENTHLFKFAQMDIGKVFPELYDHLNALTLEKVKIDCKDSILYATMDYYNSITSLVLKPCCELKFEINIPLTKEKTKALEKAIFDYREHKAELGQTLNNEREPREDIEQDLEDIIQEIDR